MKRYLFLALICCLVLVFALHAKKLKTGMNALKYKDGQNYYLYIPKQLFKNPEGAGLLVSVHGTNGMDEGYAGKKVARANAERWQGVADMMGWVVLAPQFDRGRFGKYQTLNIGGEGPRSDLRLNELVEEVGRLLPGIQTDIFHLYGFSGGGQFTMRYCMFHPERIARAVASSAGMYTFPDDSLPFPLGTNLTHLGMSIRPNMLALSQLDLLIVVGKSDVSLKDAPRRFYDYDLVKLQGLGRYQRGQNFIKALGGYVIGKGYLSKVKLKAVQGTQHNISWKIQKVAAQYLMDKD